MNKISLVSKKKEKYVEIKLNSSQNINVREVEAISQGTLPGLIVPKVIKNKLIRYDVTNFISVAEYFKAVVSKQNFLDVITQVFDIINDSQRIILNPNYFVYDKKFIFVDIYSKRVKVIYIPIINYEYQNAVKEFYNSLVFDTVFNQTEDCSYVKEYLNFFTTHVNFSVYEFENFVRKLAGGVPVRSSVGMSSQIAHPSKLLAKNGASGRLCPNCNAEYSGGGNFCEICGGKLISKVNKPVIKQEVVTPIPQVANGTTVLGAEEYGTTVLSPQELSGKVYPFLIRVKNGERIDINTSEFAMGKSGVDSNYSISDNGAVSRKHMKLVIRDNRYFVVDFASTNGTYIDDVKVVPNVETEIKPGQMLRLANEEFNFEV